MVKVKKILSFLLLIVILWAVFYSNGLHNDDIVLPGSGNSSEQSENPQASTPSIDKDGTYCTKEDVALYIHTYGRLPKNYMSKDLASAMGWRGGGLEEYAPGFGIGGNKFGNYEGILPTSYTRTYRECDIDTLGMDSRGAKRIVYSNDGLIYYTADHYQSFELLYGEEP